MKTEYEIIKDNNIDTELVKYVENEIFPLYNRNEEGHGIEHIKTVIKRSLELAKNMMLIWIWFIQ